MPGRIDALGVGVDDDFGEHLGVIAVTTTARVCSAENGVAQPINCLIQDTHEVISGDICFQIHRQEKLIHGTLNVQKKPSLEMVARHFHFTKEMLLFVV